MKEIAMNVAIWIGGCATGFFLGMAFQLYKDIKTYKELERLDGKR